MKHEELFSTEPKIQSSRLNVLPKNPESDDAKKSRFPSWLHRKMPQGGNLWKTNEIVQEKRLHTVCEEAKCPNILECYSKKTATFLVMGKECTRACGFCEISHAKTPKPVDPDEPKRLAASVQSLGLKHVVITMVARDDLDDGGASHLVSCIEEIRKLPTDITCEVLTSDFEGKKEALDKILNAHPEIFNHNIETVRSKTALVRHKATYDRSLEVLKYVKNKSAQTLVKSGIMVGLGETKAEVVKTLQDLAFAKVDIVTIGQYLQPSIRKLSVKEFIHPEIFKEYEDIGYNLGIGYVYSGPFVRSSYNANIIIERKGKAHAIWSE